jgi:nucleotide-binding universal stress UspA family protein
MLLHHILVPLDGAKDSELAIPVAAFLAARAGARVTLLHVLEAQPPQTVHGQRHLADERQAQDYLAHLAQAAFGPSVKVTIHVHTPAVQKLAPSLELHAAELQADLVIMCAHGRIRLRDRLFGNLAQRILASQTCPVLAVDPGRQAATPATPPFQRILVPLDGSLEHESAIAPAAVLAELCGASLELVTVVRTVGSLKNGQAASAVYLPAAASEEVRIEETQASQYLGQMAQQLVSKGLTVTTRIDLGDPARRIPAIARSQKADLVVLASHGRAGSEAFWAGSVGAKLLRRTQASLLMVPAAKSPG